LTDRGLKNRYIQPQCANFTSTYKFALLLAITELSVEIGQDNGQPLAIPIRLLAEKTIELYWQQTLPYWTAQPDHNGIFWQNTSKQAAIINSVLSLRQAGCHSLAQARTHPDWASIVRQVGDTLKKCQFNTYKTSMANRYHFSTSHNSRNLRTTKVAI